jgi:hypothetical protein
MATSRTRRTRQAGHPARGERGGCHGRVTPRFQTGGMDPPALRAPARGLANPPAHLNKPVRRGFVNPRSHTGRMRPSRRASSTHSAPVGLGESQLAALAPIAFPTLGKSSCSMRAAAGTLGQRVKQLGRRSKSVPKGCPQRDSSVTGGGTRGALQRSAPQVRPRSRANAGPASRRTRAGWRLTTSVVGPTAHRSHPTLPVLLDCWTAGPSWCDL